jgi:hypothetical protein
MDVAMYGKVAATVHVEMEQPALDPMLQTVALAQFMPTGMNMVSAHVTDAGDKNQLKDAVIATHAPATANALMVVSDLMMITAMHVDQMPKWTKTTNVFVAKTGEAHAVLSGWDSVIVAVMAAMAQEPITVSAVECTLIVMSMDIALVMPNSELMPMDVVPFVKTHVPQPVSHVVTQTIKTPVRLVTQDMS